MEDPKRTKWGLAGATMSEIEIKNERKREKRK